MSTETIYRVDREGWPRGEWDGEPDRLEFRTAAGYPGLVLRSHMGALCGYVAVPPGHPLHGGGLENVEVDVHGGLTYADRCHGPICHVPQPGEPDDVWWLGFDCAHAGDVIPSTLRWSAIPAILDLAVHRYRNIAYAREQCERLANSLRFIATATARKK